jgi:hypothetical protein
MIPELQASVRRVHDRLLQYGEAEEVARVSAFLGDVIRRAAPPAHADTAT